jgi:hypothetical protein
MRAALIPLISLMAAMSSGALQDSMPESPSNPGFHWSIRKTHELRYHINQGNSKDISDSERTALIRQVEAEVRPWMSDYGIGSEKELHKLVLGTRVELDDLNGDGVPEMLLQAFDVREGCGATGNCTLWVFEKTTNGYRKLLDTRGKDGIGGIERVRIGPNRTNGYLDLTLAAHDSASEMELAVYTFRDGSYRLSACYEANWLSDKDPTQGLEYPSITPISCY